MRPVPHGPNDSTVTNDDTPPTNEHDAQAWFDEGAPVPDSYVDPQLVSMDEPEDRVGFAAVLVLVAAFAAFVGAQYTSELAYVFTSGDPIALNEGSPDEYMIAPAFFEDEQLVVPSNRLVDVVGILERRSRSDDRIFHKLVGSHIYVEREFVDDRPRVLQGTPIREEPGADSYRATYEGVGRLIAFEDLPKRYERFIAFYSDSYQVAFCGFEPSADLELHFRRITSEAEFALREELGRTPSREEVAERLSGATACQNGYLLIAGRDPASYRIFLGIYLVIGVILVGALTLLIRRFRPTSD